MNQKVGILTFSYSSNPGSVLQAYALQKTINDMDGQNAFIINYQKTGADRPVVGQNVFYGPLRTWTPKKLISWTVRCIAYPARMRKYKRFFNKYYRFDPQNHPCLKEELSTYLNSYDAFVVGSDQVWNFDSINVDTTYFLDFVKNGAKKISYAASLGRSGIPEDKQAIAEPLLRDFSAVSVRERSSVKAVQTLSSVLVEWVLDPSLLLDKEWNDMAIAPKEKNYVFLYLREDTPQMEEFANKLAERHGLSLIKVMTHWKCDKNGNKRKPLGPLEWLGYVNNAKYVVTNSFHGICFSLVYRKNFYVDLLKGERAFTNPRIAEVLEQFELMDRCIDGVDGYTTTPVDYEAVDAIREQRKQASLTYLRNALGKTKDEA